MAHILKNYVQFIPGVNPSRLERELIVDKSSFYDQASFDKDFKIQRQTSINDKPDPNSPELYGGEIVISNNLQLATIVSNQNHGKILTTNFMKVNFRNRQLDPTFFLYLFNSSKSIQRQKEREVQGTGSLKKITIKSLEKIKIPEIPLKKQQQLGQIYLETIDLQSKLALYADLLNQATSQILENQLTHGGNHV